MYVIFLPYGIGDVLMAVPAIRRLATLRGVANITVVVQGKVQSHFLRNLVGPQLQVIERRNGARFAEARLWWRLARLRPQFIAAPMLSQRRLRFSFFGTLLARTLVPSDFISRKILRVQPASICLEEFEGHQVNYFVQFLSELEPSLDRSRVSESEWCIKDSAEEALSHAAPTRVAVGISCGMIERHKIPSPEWIAELINGLAKNAPIKLVIPASRSDGALVERLKRNLDQDIETEILVDLPPDQLFSKLQNCSLGISGTTGQGHMMAVANLPMLVLAGVTNPYESGPYVRRALILRHNFVCGPCYQKSYVKGCGRVVCMETLDVAVGVRKAKELLCDPLAGIGWLKKVRKPRSIPVSAIEALHRQPMSNWTTME